MRIFEPMTQIVQPGRLGVAEVQHFDVDRFWSQMSTLRPGEFVPEGRYAKLLVNGEMVMSDTRLEHITNYGVVRKAHGRVLIGGLGLGMILIPILQKKEVANVLVVEQSADVVALVQPSITRAIGAQVARKLTVIVDDIFTWTPAKRGRQFDTIYFDIWPDVCVDNLSEMMALRRRFASYLVKDGWAACWRQDELRRRSKSE